MRAVERKWATRAAVCVAFAALCAALTVALWPTGPRTSTHNPQSSAPRLSRRGTATFVVEANGRVTGEIRRRVAGCGARVSGVLPPDRIVVEADGNALERIRADRAFAAVTPLAAADKMSAELKRVIADGAGGDVEITVIPLRGEDAGVIAGHLVSRGVKPDEVVAKGRGRVCAGVPAELAVELAARGDVRWVERYIRPRLLNDVAVQPGLLNIEPMRTVQGLTGRGQTVTISDSGLDTGNPATVMDDFTNRVAFLRTVEGCKDCDSSGHGTHVAGTLAGDGSLSGGAFKGVAYGATLNVWQCLASDGLLYFPDFDLLFQPDRANSPSYIHSGSWGGGERSAYDSWCVEVDDWMWRHPENLSVFSAGNDGTERSILSPAGAKNVIAVGATESLRPENRVG